MSLLECCEWVTSEIKAYPGKIRLHAWSTGLCFWWSSRYLKSWVLRARKPGVWKGGGDHPKIRWYHTIDSWLFEILWLISPPRPPHTIFFAGNSFCTFLFAGKNRLLFLKLLGWVGSWAPDGKMGWKTCQNPSGNPCCWGITQPCKILTLTWGVG